MTENTIPYEFGLHQLTDSCYAWLIPDGNWGLSNAGLITGGQESLLVDTLFDLKMTQEMLDGMKHLTDDRPITTIANTHANGDHWFGNELVPGAEIIASDEAGEQMRAEGTDFILDVQKKAGSVGRYTTHLFEPFRFDDITPTPPTRTFSDTLTLDVDGIGVDLIKLGPGHTDGDIVAWVPSERVLYAGDLLFIGGTPLSWAGPITNWISACDRMLELDPAFVVPGHGPVVGRDGINDVRDYLVFISEETKKRFDAGVPFDRAISEISENLGRFEQLHAKNRVAQNVITLYHDFDPSFALEEATDAFAYMAELDDFR
jgi:cyclase